MSDKKTPPLPRYTLEKNDKRGGWDLKQEGATRARKHFENKADATACGALSDALPGGVGSVRIHKEDGKNVPKKPGPKRHSRMTFLDRSEAKEDGMIDSRISDLGRR